MSNMGNKVSRLSAGTQARQTHRTVELLKIGLSSYEVAQRHKETEPKIVKKTAKKRRKSK